MVTTTKLPDSARKLIADQAYMHVATVNADGSPQLSMVWGDVDDDQLLINTTTGRRKVSNLERDGRVAITVQDVEDRQLHLLIHGHVVEITTEGAEEHIDRLSQRFIGREQYPWHDPEHPRLLIRIAVDRIGGMGPWMEGR